MAATPVRATGSGNRTRTQALAWRPTLDDLVSAVSDTFGVDRAKLLTSRRHGNDGGLTVVCLARSLTDAAVGVIGQYFGDVSPAAISKAIQRAEDRRSSDRNWNRRLAKLAPASLPPATTPDTKVNFQDAPRFFGSPSAPPPPPISCKFGTRPKRQVPTENDRRE